MILFNGFQYILFSVIFVKFKDTNCILTSFSPSNSANIRLLGIFHKEINASNTTDSFYAHSLAMFQAAILLSHRYNITIDGQYIGWQIAAPSGKTIDTLSETCCAVSASNIVGIVGPGFSREAHTIAGFGEKTGIPVISYAATDPDLSNRNNFPNFFRTVPSDNTAALAIAKLFVRFNWSSCIIIYQDDAFGAGGAKSISEEFNKKGLTIRQMILFNIATSSIQGNLKNDLINSPTRVIIVWAASSYQTSLILQQALNSNVVGPLFTWILSSNIPLDSFNKTFHEKLIGILLVEPIVGSYADEPFNETLLAAAYHIWKQNVSQAYPTSLFVNDYALFTFDATWALIKSLEKLCSSLVSNSSSCFSKMATSFCFDYRLNHSNLLLDTISDTNFLGVSGPVRFSKNVTDRINGSYYYVKNLQADGNSLKFVPALEYSQSGEWRRNAKDYSIIWPGNVLTQPTGRAILRSVTLRIGVIESIPFTIVTQIVDSNGSTTIKLTGYTLDLIQMLQEKTGFIPNITLVPSNKTYFGSVKAVNTGDYDILIGDVTVTAIRRELVGFSNAIFDNSLRIITRKTEDVRIDLFSFLKPFSRNLWLLAIGSCIYAGILMWIIERHNNEALQNRSILSQLAMSIWYSFGNLVGYGVGFNASTAAGRLLTSGIYILSLVLVASYTANLASDLTISKSKESISSINDIKSGKIPFNRIGIRLGTAGEDFFLREISGGMRNFYPLTSRKETYDSLLAGVIDVSFIDSGVGEYVTNNIYCNLTLAGEDFDKGIFGIVSPKQWLYIEDLDVHILSLKESGALDSLKQKWFEFKKCPDSTETSTAIGVQATSGLFIIFGGITILSLLYFIWSKRNYIKSYLVLSICRIAHTIKERYSRRMYTKSKRSSIISQNSSTF